MMKGSRRNIFMLVAVFFLFLAGCSSEKTELESTSPRSSQASNGDGKLRVVASIYPIVEFSRQVAGDKAEVIGLIPAGAEPHDWEPSPKDIATIKQADVFVYNGIVEGWVEQALKSAANDRRIVVETIKGIELIEGEEHDHDHVDGHDHDHSHDHTDSDGHDHEHDGHADGHGHDHKDVHANDHDHDHSHDHAHDHGHSHNYEWDPHVWLSPVLAQQQVRAIQAALEQADPQRKEDYKRNADAYIAKLKEMDQAFRDGLNGVKRKEFVVQHAAFGYLAREYGLRQIPIAGLSPEQEPAPDRMADIVKFAKEHQVTTIFFETLVDPKIARTIANEIGAKTAVLNPLEGLTASDIKNNADYIGIMKSNLEALKQALHN